MTSLATAFLIGLAGSLHCVAMCGPLNVALRVGRATSTQMLYHGGRIAMYALAGAVAGALGHGLMAVGLGRALSIVGGLALLAAAVYRLGWLSRGRVAERVTAFIGHALRRLPAAGRRWPMLVAGALNALLPCGMLYAAVAVAATAGSWHGGVLVMAAFGAGTVPALVALPLILRWMPLIGSSRARLAAPAALAIAGILLVARSLAP